MDIVLFMIDSSPKETQRDPVRFSRLIEIALKTDIQEINLVSRRDFKIEEPALNQIPEKIVSKEKGIFNKIKPEKLRKNHIQTDHFELASLLAFLGKDLKTTAFFFFEDEPEELTYDGSHSILKFARASSEKSSAILGLKRIPFSGIHQYRLLKGTLVGEGEYRINAAFRVDHPLQSSSNLALMKRFILRPPFFKILDSSLLRNHENAFLDALDTFVKTEPVYGYLPFIPLKIK